MNVSRPTLEMPALTLHLATLCRRTDLDAPQHKRTSERFGRTTVRPRPSVLVMTDAADAIATLHGQVEAEILPSEWLVEDET